MESTTKTQLGVGENKGKNYLYEVDLNSDGINEYRMENDSVQVTLLRTGARVIEYIVKSKNENLFFKPSDFYFEYIISIKESLYSENLSQTKLIAVVCDILNQYSQSNTTVLVTNCREERAIMTLNQHDLTNKFTHKFFRKSIDNDFHINKFENALTSLNLNPKAVIVFENDVFEIEEAINAGIPKENIYTI